MELEVVELEDVAGGVWRVDEQGAHHLGGVELHLGGQLAAEEGYEEEAEFAGGAKALDAGVAEADGFAFGFGNDGDVSVSVETHADAGVADARAEA